MTLPNVVSNLLSLLPVVVTILGAYLAALWFCMIIWTFRDIQKRTSDILVQILATILVLIFNLPGLWLYLILRPPETLADLYARSLEEEALIREISSTGTCPGCKTPTEADFIVCPDCGTCLRNICGSCSRLLQLHWQICPYCGQPYAKSSQRRSVAPVTKEDPGFP